MKEEAVEYSELISGAPFPSVWRYAEAIPVGPRFRVSLNEGGTPLTKSLLIGPKRGLRSLYFKNDGQNPTGSFKDRGMTVVVTRAREVGAHVLVCASTGNTSASLSAYAARAGLHALVLLPSGKVAPGKLVQAVVHGAEIVKVDGDFDAALEAVRGLSSRRRTYLVNSLNPYRIEGQKTVAFEIYEQLGGQIPDYVILPVGNAGNISAVWKGFRELHDWGIVEKVPIMVGVQASGASPLAKAISKGEKTFRRERHPETVASAIRIGNPVSWEKAMNAVQESRGTILAVTDAEIVRARNALASEEGLFVELASSAPVAALKHLGKIRPDDLVVCIATGSGLKDSDSVKVNLEKMRAIRSAKSINRLA